MSRSRWVFLVALIVACVSAAPAAQAQTGGRVWFVRNVLALHFASELGTAKSTQRMEVGIGLKDPNAADEAALLAAQENPASPEYEKYLSPSQFDARFAVPAAAFDRVLEWARAGGA